jgi:hypothetical protein
VYLRILKIGSCCSNEGATEPLLVLGGKYTAGFISDRSAESRTPSVSRRVAQHNGGARLIPPLQRSVASSPCRTPVYCTVIELREHIARRSTMSFMRGVGTLSAFASALTLSPAGLRKSSFRISPGCTDRMPFLATSTLGPDFYGITRRKRLMYPKRYRRRGVICRVSRVRGVCSARQEEFTGRTAVLVLHGIEQAAHRPHCPRPVSRCRIRVARYDDRLTGM